MKKWLLSVGACFLGIIAAVVMVGLAASLSFVVSGCKQPVKQELNTAEQAIYWQGFGEGLKFAHEHSLPRKTSTQPALQQLPALLQFPEFPKSKLKKVDGNAQTKDEKAEKSVQ